MTLLRLPCWYDSCWIQFNAPPAYTYDVVGPSLSLLVLEAKVTWPPTGVGSKVSGEADHDVCLGLQVFSFSANAMPDDISVMTMAGERTRSGPPKDVKQ